jgi:RimJ/RimL family protein N-acetyltransferase
MSRLPPNTHRLAFRGWQAEDLEAFFAICSNPRVMQYVGDGQAWSKTRTLAFIERAEEMFRACGFCQWAVLHQADNKLIGYCGFVTTDEAPEIGWRLAPEYWGQGLATEAAHAVLTYGLEILGFPRVIATIQADNQASIRIALKLGMGLESTLERQNRRVLIYSAKGTSHP